MEAKVSAVASVDGSSARIAPRAAPLTTTPMKPSQTPLRKEPVAIRTRPPAMNR